MAERPSVKDILAAVRKGGPAQPEAPSPAEPAEKAVPPPAPSLGRPMTLQEKLAAARGAAPAGGAAKPAAAGGAAKPAAAKPAAAKAAARELPPLDKITDPKDLAEALRQAGAK